VTPTGFSIDWTHGEINGLDLIGHTSRRSMALVHLEFHLQDFFITISFHAFYKESYQEDLDEFSHVEGLDETLVSIFPLEEDEVVNPCEEVINSIDVGKFMRNPQIKLKIILMISYVFRSVDGMLVASILMEIPSRTFRETSS
jgi:hypothetical protein